MKFPLFVTFTLGSLLPVNAWSDTIVLTNGKTLEGEIISESETHYNARIAIKETIFERKRLPKDKVLRIEKAEAGIDEWNALAPLELPADLATAEDYEQRLTKVEGFINAFPDNSKVPEARSHLADLRQELARIKSGQVKFDGKWLRAVELKRRALELDSTKLAKELESHRQKGLYLSVLRQFHREAPPFRYTPAYAQMKECAIQSAERYITYLEKEIPRAEARKKKWEQTLLNSSPSQRTRAQRAHQKNLAQFEARQNEDEQEQQVWLIYSPYDSEGLTQGLRRAKQQLQMLKNEMLQEFDAVATTKEFWDAIDKSELNQAVQLFGSMNGQYVGETYRESMQDAIDALDQRLRKEEELERQKQLEAESQPSKD